MAYNLIWEEQAINDLNSLCSSVSVPLQKKIESYLTKSSQELGKPLTGKYKKLYRYRYGDYRIIYEVDKNNKLVSVLRVWHRSEVYN
ncbi:MAG TPA: type II toxin-antitoxin system RelE/ParE family toxin [Rickettsia endosymbiont of Degeeriella rufa]|nr:type II toxin-antitoxin system RelE/ParE family toxin [Rickettsia endosymbiont of Columbicola hoogstraali]HJD62330.1 type II toxin-antitoxin system RelE/ParE family toxin [Rickettsia endosymbiont of Degeeriella rufa]